MEAVGHNSSKLLKGGEELVSLIARVHKISHEPITEERFSDLQQKVKNVTESMLWKDLDPVLQNLKVNSEPSKALLAEVEEAMAKIEATPSRQSVIIQKNLEQLEDIIADKENLRKTLQAEVDLHRNNLEKLNGYEERLRTLDKELTSFKIRYNETSLELKKLDPSTLKVKCLMPLIEKALAQAKEDETALSLLRKEILSQPDARKEELYNKLRAISLKSIQNSKSPKYNGADEEFFS
ncbi:uncharacterized protein LOC110844262 [Folsomia candida]|uniref:Uncharacterized protein n=1 Tax=Folsomia candida TaxID=158441 RepID=A0A226EQY5_FOLCA|nr:uncharacterized protein LOC110844262 [Folsomia candida]OXA60043.1 hypothetical protein Fcan01_04255 [Folsomia candida]